MKVPRFLDDMTLEELLELAGKCRFGTSMLINRTINELNTFVQKSTFDTLSEEHSFVNAYGIVPKAENEPERLRRWLILMLLFSYEKELKEAAGVGR